MYRIVSYDIVHMVRYQSRMKTMHVRTYVAPRRSNNARKALGRENVGAGWPGRGKNS